MTDADQEPCFKILIYPIIQKDGTLVEKIFLQIQEPAEMLPEKEVSLTRDLRIAYGTIHLINKNKVIRFFLN